MSEKRRHERFDHVEVIRFRPIMIDGTFSIGELGEAFSGNVSIKGVFIETPVEVPVNTPLEMYIRDPSGEETNIFGTVTRLIHKGSLTGLGVEIMDVSIDKFSVLLKRAHRGAWTDVTPRS
ncbi:MAG: PilZ domain-containing protein [Planctomycetota bacterium]